MSKRIWNHPAERPTGRKYWRSLGELEDTPDFREWLDREFPQGAAMMRDESDHGTSRRAFMQLMGAATALAGFGTAACRRPETKIKPYSKAVEWIIPGKALYYATVMPRAGGATPMVVTTHEGRPTHLQGNSLHDESNGSLDNQAQASILDLYDPDRSRTFRHGGTASSRDGFLKALEAKKGELAAAQGKGLAILLDEIVSPTRDRLIGKLKTKFPQAAVYRYEAVSNSAAASATEAVFGKGVAQVPHFSACEKIVALDSDFLGIDRPKASSVSKFMDGRRASKPGDPMNRLYVLESRYTVTGGMADHRFRIPASQTMKAAVALAKAIAEATGDAALKSAADAVKLTGELKAKENVREDYDVFIKEAAKDLVASKGGKAMVIVGPRQSTEVHILAAAINQALGAYTKAADKKVPPLELKQTTVAETGTLAQLADAVKAKSVNTLAIVSAADPVFDAPADLNWAALQKEIPTVIHVGFRDKTATARAATWHVPGTHFLEQWGDVRSMSGVYSVVQPMIQPLYGGISDIEFLSLLASDAKIDAPAPPAPPPAAPLNGLLPEPSKDIGYLAVRETFDALPEAKAAGDLETAWSHTLRDGLLKGTKWPAFAGSPNAGAISAALGKFVDVAPPTQQAMEVALVPCAKIHDGRYINNGWLQESPDPISKITWDNAALLSVRTADALKLSKYLKDEAEIIKVSVGGQELSLPVIVAPGHADNCITVALGYGQGKGENGPGRVGEGTGVDVYPVRTTKNLHFLTGASVKVSGEKMPLALTQEHGSTYGREIVREGTLERYRKNPDFAAEEGADAEIHQDFSFYKPVGKEPRTGAYDAPLLSDKQHQWAMVIDLNTCIGCNTCSMACQSENNIPIVGKRQVIIGREMHWIRMDRYFALDLDGQKNVDNHELDTNDTALPPHNEAGDHGHGGHEVVRQREVDDPEMIFQPVGCQHCEAAPCETVCPVNATVHSEDGLNLMVYNRCIGTRYCANNCPYKVRRFNFFDYNKREIKERDSSLFPNNLYLGPVGDLADNASSRLQKNPNVTVRMRGVIEKCTYCIQRIETAKIDRRQISRTKAAEIGQTGENLTLTDDELRIPTDKVRTACQQACPADAIVFGNLLDEKSAVSQLKKHPRNYQLLRYLGVRPRTSYLARIKNPNPALLAASAYERRKVGQMSAHIH